jgi:LacI family transcriptional regulator
MAGSRPTLKDVAEVAGVHPSLVSRVVNGDDRVALRAETRDRILAAIDSVGYRKNMMAQALKMGSTGLIAYVVPDLTTPTYSVLIDGAKRRASEAGYTLLVATHPAAERSSTDLRRLLDEGRVDGLLVGSGVIGDAASGGMLAGGGPVVVVNRLIDGAPCAVIPDDGAASAVAARHLAELGHRRCAIVTGPSDLDTTRRRSAGFATALKEAGLPKPLVVTAHGVGPEAGSAAAVELTTNPEITGVFSAAGLLHVGLLPALSDAGVRVPADVSVVALHESEINRFTQPPTTTVSMPLELVGATAVDLLLARLANKKTPATKVVRRPAPHLIRRGSTAEARG